jgi:beta-lactamase family protein
MLAAAIVTMLVGVSALAEGLNLATNGGSAGAAAPPTTKPTASCPPWGCEWGARFAAATTFVTGKPGHIGIVVRDRQTNAIWQAGEPDHPVWTASTIKLGIATSLLERARSGEVKLTDTDRQQMAAMLSTSDDNAATALWNRYGKDAMIPRFVSTYGMATLTFVSGYTRFWGHMKCTALDLNHLMSYILDTLNPEDRNYLVAAMRTVAPVQQWGVWAAGADWEPGTKVGWSIESDTGGKHWVTNSVGFAGPGERYVVSVMYQLLPGATSIAGGQLISDLIATVFGSSVPAPVTVPSTE